MGETWRARLLLLQIQQRRRTSSRYKFYFGRRAQGDNGEYCVLDFVQSVRMCALVKLGDQAFEKSESVVVKEGNRPPPEVRSCALGV